MQKARILNGKSFVDSDSGPFFSVTKKTPWKTAVVFTMAVRGRLGGMDFGLASSASLGPITSVGCFSVDPGCDRLVMTRTCEPHF